MSKPSARLYLITPAVTDADAFAPRLEEACASGEVAAVLLRLPDSDERSLVKLVKRLAPAAQDHGAAVLVAAAFGVDLATIAARGGADGVHLAGDPAALHDMRERLKDGGILGASNLRAKHDAMSAGEIGVDYVMFGEPRADGSLPPLDAVVERASWWAEIFETPCVAYAPSLEAVPALSATGAEFVALGEAIWQHPSGPGAAVSVALAALLPEAVR